MFILIFLQGQRYHCVYFSFLHTGTNGHGILIYHFRVSYYSVLSGYSGRPLIALDFSSTAKQSSNHNLLLRILRSGSQKEN